MNHHAIDLSQAPPLRHAELLSRVRFSLDEAHALAEKEREEKRKAFDELRAETRTKCLRITPRLMPSLHAVIRSACERLLLEEEPEAYIEKDPSLNAHCFSDGQRSLLYFNSGLVQLLEPEELASVVGHEVAHATYRHGTELPDDERSSAALFDRERDRAQEVSADRVGLLAASAPEHALRAELKLATGLDSAHLAHDIDAVLEQLATVDPEIDADWDDFSTHPSFPFRFWSQHRFIQSDLYRRLRGLSGGLPFSEVEAEIEGRFQSIGSSHAFRATADHVHEAIAWLGVLTVAADGTVTEVERTLLVELVGRIWADDAYMYAQRHGLKAVERRAKETLSPLRYASRHTRARVEDALRELIQRANALDRHDELMRLVAEATKR